MMLEWVGGLLEAFQPEVSGKKNVCGCVSFGNCEHRTLLRFCHTIAFSPCRICFSLHLSE